MLVECWQLAQALAKAGIAVPNRHTDFLKPGETKCTIRVAIGSEGVSVASIVPKSEQKALWLMRDSNKNRWPILKPQKEVLDVSSCQLLIDQARRLATHQLAKFGDKCPTQLAELKTRLDYLQTKSVLEAIRAIPDKPNPIEVAFDLLEDSIYTSVNRASFEGVLANLPPKGQLGHCSLSGVEGYLWSGKLPDPQLPEAAEAGIAIFSMFSDAKTNTRYGRTNDGIIQVTTETVQACLNAIMYVTQEEAKGRTWTSIPNGKREKQNEKKDLLIAYASGLDAPVADGFGGGDPETYNRGVLQPIIEALKGKCKLTPKAEIQLIAIRQISNAQIQAVYGRNPTVQQALTAGQRWDKAQKTLPGLVVTSSKSTWLLSPGRAVSLLLRRWIDVPLRSELVPGPSGGDLIDFFLAEGDDRRDRARLLLDRLLYVDSHLLARTASEARKNPNHDQPNKEPEFKRYVVDAVKLLALIYDSMDRTMNQTQHSPPYQLGLLLGVVDTLHRCYCEEVRNSVPPSLGGSQLLGIAADDPARALSDLLERIRPWSDWATKAKPKDEQDKYVLQAKKAMSRLGSISPELQGKLSDSPLDPVGRADLLLGYLSKDAEADQYATTTTSAKAEGGQTNE